MSLCVLFQATIMGEITVGELFPDRDKKQDNGEDSGSGGNWMLSMAWGLVEDQITDHMWEWLCDEWELCVGDSYQEIIESLSGEVLSAVWEMVTGGEEAATL